MKFEMALATLFTQADFIFIVILSEAKNIGDIKDIFITEFARLAAKNLSG